MPTKVQVKVNTIQHTSQVSQAGNELNYVEITGFDATNNRGFKKRFFATKKDGTATQKAEIADALSQDDWAEITLDDTSYHNVQTLKKIATPAGMTAPSQASAEIAYPKAKKGGFKKGGEFRTVPQLNREVALREAVRFADPAENGVDDVLVVAKAFEDYLVGKPCCPQVDGEVREVAPNGNVIVNPTPGGGVEEDVTGIPF